MESVSGEDLILPNSPLNWTMVSMDLWRWKEDRKEPTIITDGNPPSNPSHISHKGYYSFLLPWLYFNVLQAKVLLGQRKETRPELSSDSVEASKYLHERDPSLVPVFVSVSVTFCGLDFFYWNLLRLLSALLG